MEQFTHKRTTFHLTLFEWLFNPFEKIKQPHSLIIGLIILLITAVSAHYAKLYFPGVIDCLTVDVLETDESYSILNLLAQLSCTWLVISLVFCFASIKLPIDESSAKTYLFYDIFGATALARLPYLVLTLFFTYIQFQYPHLLDVDHGVGLTFHATNTTLLFSSFVFFSYVWQLITYYYVYRSVSPYTGWQHLLAYVASIVIAEFISIYVIAYFVLSD